MKELLRGKGTKSHMADVPKRTPLANFTFYLYIIVASPMFSLPHIYRNALSFQHQVTDWTIWVRIAAGTRHISLTQTAQTGFGFTQPHIQCVPAIFSGGKMAGV
jgi:hypothetical protein